MPEEAPRDQSSWRREYCLKMLRWAIVNLREVKCETVEEDTLQINALGYLGNCYIAEGGTLEQLQALDTEKWFTTKPNEGFPL